LKHSKAIDCWDNEKNKDKYPSNYKKEETRYSFLISEYSEEKAKV
jgi:hypothetical protein